MHLNGKNFVADGNCTGAMQSGYFLRIFHQWGKQPKGPQILRYDFTTKTKMNRSSMTKLVPYFQSCFQFRLRPNMTKGPGDEVELYHLKNVFDAYT